MRMYLSDILNKAIEILESKTYEEIDKSIHEKSSKPNDVQIIEKKCRNTVYQRYALYKNNSDKKETMSENGAKILEEFLELNNIPIVEFLNSKGGLLNLKKILELSSMTDIETDIEKKEDIEIIEVNDNLEKYKNMSLKELEDLKESLIERKVEIQSKYFGKNSIFYPNNEEFKKILDEITENLKIISKEISIRSNFNNYTDVSEQTEVIERDDLLKSDDCNHDLCDQIEQLKNMNYDLQNDNSRLNFDLRNITQKLKNTEEKCSEMEIKVNDLTKENAIISKKNKDLELENNCSFRTVEKIKSQIVELLIKYPKVSVDFISKNINPKIDNRLLKLILNDIKDEIPGLHECDIINGKMCNYEIGGTAKERLSSYEYQKNIHEIYASENQVLKFIVRSDGHINLRISEDDLKRMMEPYFNLSSINGNAPIIDLGDIADTLDEFEYKDWNYNNKEAVELSYRFYQNYANVISREFSKLNNYVLFGNHDRHPFLCGVDPVKIILNYSDNIKYLGMMESDVLIKDLKVGLFHGLFNDYNKSINIKSDLFDLELESLADEYDVALIGHYHYPMYYKNPDTLILKNGIFNPTIITVEIKGNVVQSISANLIRFGNYNSVYDNNTIQLYKRPKIKK